ncbi:Transposase [Aquiflexum balticum DSM 16537]|jgi:transposase|uniref:Transposase n=1 Tax=Aquiflexum balticum DSM 16537 TaxID=758820 RepID=A0A1W2HAH5_9BACT|nr:transposase [Aquiflexum balticum]SMD43802.1 Transposase [Aquiflexum balticum DSM 16537]SMD44261.1 Transposase [Aquiflexum balticum DSM 16537]SMD45873.1 Transposase [Aquiflexum balticum DSM 16537]SMD46048.1 Transposase [Aquiflexum balticum DSM 16537]
MTIDERRRRRFSEEFRKEQVCLIESGRVSIIEVSRLHEVKVESVKRWLVRFGKKKLPEKIIVTTGRDIDRLRELEKENRRLLELIGRQQVELVYQKELIILAEEKLGENFKKK